MTLQQCFFLTGRNAVRVLECRESRERAADDVGMFSLESLVPDSSVCELARLQDTSLLLFKREWYSGWNYFLSQPGKRYDPIVPRGQPDHPTPQPLKWRVVAGVWSAIVGRSSLKSLSVFTVISGGSKLEAMLQRSSSDINIISVGLSNVSCVHCVFQLLRLHSLCSLTTESAC